MVILLQNMIIISAVGIIYFPLELSLQLELITLSWTTMMCIAFGFSVHRAKQVGVFRSSVPVQVCNLLCRVIKITPSNS